MKKGGYTISMERINGGVYATLKRDGEIEGTIQLLRAESSTPSTLSSGLLDKKLSLWQLLEIIQSTRNSPDLFLSRLLSASETPSDTSPATSPTTASTCTGFSSSAAKSLRKRKSSAKFRKS